MKYLKDVGMNHSDHGLQMDYESNKTEFHHITEIGVKQL
jgi:hypothetical protein